MKAEGKGRYVMEADKQPCRRPAIVFADESSRTESGYARRRITDILTAVRRSPDDQPDDDGFLTIGRIKGSLSIPTRPGLGIDGYAARFSSNSNGSLHLAVRIDKGIVVPEPQPSSEKEQISLLLRTAADVLALEEARPEDMETARSASTLAALLHRRHPYGPVLHLGIAPRHHRIAFSTTLTGTEEKASMEAANIRLGFLADVLREELPLIAAVKVTEKAGSYDVSISRRSFCVHLPIPPYYVEGRSRSISAIDAMEVMRRWAPQIRAAGYEIG